MAWNLDGHTAISRKAARDFGSSLGYYEPRYIDLDNIDWNVVLRDIEDLKGDHWSPEGQRHHFMRAKDQKQIAAYMAGVGWISDNGIKAATILKARIDCMRIASDRIRSGAKWSARDLLSCMRTGEVEKPLGNALHALQDSFAPAHVVREKGTLRILELLVYESTRASDLLDKVTPGKNWHESQDESWQKKDGSLSELAEAAASASVALLRCMVSAALSKEPAKAFGSIAKDSLMDKYLKPALVED